MYSAGRPTDSRQLSDLFLDNCGNCPNRSDAAMWANAAGLFRIAAILEAMQETFNRQDKVFWSESLR